VRPDGRILSPNMPWRNFASLTDDDAYAIAAYLKTLKPVHREPPPRTGASQTPPAPYLAVTMPQP
jgi:cytochrome c